VTILNKEEANEMIIARDLTIHTFRDLIMNKNFENVILHERPKLIPRNSCHC
jgi:hypothetical protein